MITTGTITEGEMKPLKFRRLPVKPLPADPTILDYIECGFQWVTHWLVIDKDTRLLAEC